jgi:hypothetical protein
MPKGKSADDLSTLQMALVGYQFEKQKIDEKIRQIETQLKGGKASRPEPAAEAKAKPVRRQLSAAARKRIAAAQRKRWAEHRRMKAAQGK